MARINIEDSIFKDNRFIELVIAMRGIDSALGALVRAWILAQKWYLSEDKMIPLHEWQEQKISNHLIEVGLAEIVGDKVRVRGADHQFTWLLQRQEAGKKGGEASAKRKATVAKRSVDETNPPTLSPSPSPSLSLSSISSSSSKGISGDVSPVPQKNQISKKPTDSEKAKTERRELLAFWLSAYQQAKNNEYPEPRSAKTNSQIKKIHDSLGAEKAKELLVAYLKIKKPYYVERGHSLEVFQRDIPGVASWAQNAIQNVTDIKKFQFTKEAIADGSLKLQTKSQIFKSVDNLRTSPKVQRELPSEANGQIPSEFDGSFNQDLYGETDRDAFSDSCEDPKYLSEHS